MVEVVEAERRWSEKIERMLLVDRPMVGELKGRKGVPRFSFFSPLSIWLVLVIPPATAGLFTFLPGENC